MYVCECGKQFKSLNALNGHKSHCLTILGYDRWYVRNVTQMKQMSQKGCTKVKDETLLRKEEKLTKWISEQHTCEKCGKVMTEKYGSGRFCSRACANSRSRTEDTKIKIRESCLNTLKNKDIADSKFLKGRTFSGYYKDIYCASGYELIFILYCEEHNIKVTRCPYKFNYTYNGKNKVYLPDLYLPESNTIVELKGRGIYYNEQEVKLKCEAVKNSTFNFKIIYDDEFLTVYFEWAKSFYNFTKYSYKDFCISKYKNTDFNKLSKKHLPRTKNYIFINNGIKNTCVPKDKAADFLNSGWNLGMLK